VYQVDICEGDPEERTAADFWELRQQQRLTSTRGAAEVPRTQSIMSGVPWQLLFVAISIALLAVLWGLWVVNVR
jgi:hypothetical protein